MSDLFWKVSAVLLIAALFYVGNALQTGSRNSLPGFVTPAFANVSVATDNHETVLTSSDDGRTVYIWRYYGAKPPKYLGKAEVVANR